MEWDIELNLIYILIKKNAAYLLAGPFLFYIFNLLI